MGKLSVEVTRAKAAGDKKVAGLEGAVRSLDNRHLEVGEHSTMHEN